MKMLEATRRRMVFMGGTEKSDLQVIIPAKPLDEALQAFLERHFRRETDRRLDLCEVGTGFEHVARLRGQELGFGFLAEQLLKHADEEEGLDWPVVAEVEDAHRRGGALCGRVEEHFHDAVHDVLYISEVAEVFPLIEQLE